jgi:hypothetical protein
MTQRLALLVLILSCASLRAAEPPTFSSAVDAAKRLSITKAYQQYEQSKFWPAIGTLFANAMVACTRATKSDVTFDCVFVIAADGHVKRILHAPHQLVPACVAKQLQGVALPPPPHDSWHVLVHMSTHR